MWFNVSKISVAFNEIIVSKYLVNFYVLTYCSRLVLVDFVLAKCMFRLDYDVCVYISIR